MYTNLDNNSFNGVNNTFDNMNSNYMANTNNFTTNTNNYGNPYLDEMSNFMNQTPVNNSPTNIENNIEEISKTGENMNMDNNSEEKNASIQNPVAQPVKRRG